MADDSKKTLTRRETTVAVAGLAAAATVGGLVAATPKSSQEKTPMSTALSGPAIGGKAVGPSFSAAEVPDVVEALLTTFRELRQPGEFFIDCLRRTGHDAFKAAANAARHPKIEAFMV